jgi:hypothetical protein
MDPVTQSNTSFHSLAVFPAAKQICGWYAAEERTLCCLGRYRLMSHHECRAELGKIRRMVLVRFCEIQYSLRRYSSYIQEVHLLYTFPVLCYVICPFLYVPHHSFEEYASVTCLFYKRVE